jgi:hypothetical protein
MGKAWWRLSALFSSLSTASQHVPQLKFPKERAKNSSQLQKGHFRVLLASRLRTIVFLASWLKGGRMHPMYCAHERSNISVDRKTLGFGVSI